MCRNSPASLLQICPHRAARQVTHRDDFNQSCTRVCITPSLNVCDVPCEEDCESACSPIKKIVAHSTDVGKLFIGIVADAPRWILLTAPDESSYLTGTPETGNRTGFNCTSKALLKLQVRCLGILKHHILSRASDRLGILIKTNPASPTSFQPDL
jgi:hypothetical protein